MINPGLLHPLAWIDLEYMSAGKAALIFLVLCVPVVLLGLRSLAGLGPVRRWVAVGLRMAVLLMLVLIFAGARWQRQHKSVEVMVLRDISGSTQLYRGFGGKNLQESIDDYLRAASESKYKLNPDDRIGVISFSNDARIDSMPNPTVVLDSRAIREPGKATDIAAGIQTALATFQRNAMRRIVLLSDGNQTMGDLETALAAAVSQRVPIDVLKLSYSVLNEVMIERVSAPSMKKEGDPFDVFVSLVSTNTRPVSGALEVLEEGQRLEKEPRRITLEPARIDEQGKLEPRKHVERFHVPALRTGGVRRFKAIFHPDGWNAAAPGAPANAEASGDTLAGNNEGSAFTFVQGTGRVLYVDGTPDGSGRTLLEVLRGQSINAERVNIDQVPDDLVALQSYDAIILNNVSLVGKATGASGLSLEQDALLARYVHDFGGGIVMIGGPDSMGAGSWQNSKLEEVMPVNFDIPAQRQMPKGALVVVIHSCEMPNGNYWGQQCAIKAIETLTAQDEVGVISFDWGGARGPGVGGSVWNYELKPKGDGARAIDAVKRMTPGDMPSFDDCVELALNGNKTPNAACLSKSNAAQKHMIIISDGDPQQPRQQLLQQCIAQKITISTVSVYPHGGFVPGTMQQIAKITGGRYYGPIEKNPGQLPQIFMKEATVVRRTLVQESMTPPMSVLKVPTDSDMMKGIPDENIPPVYGIVLSVEKKNPSVVVPLWAVLNGKKDPLFAHWQAGLGKAAVYASGGSKGWDQPWVQSFGGNYGKFWSQVVRGVSRPPMSRDFNVTTELNGDKARVVVEATREGAQFANFLNILGTVVDPDGKQQEIRLVQIGPGTYSAEFPLTASQKGAYVTALRYSGEGNQQGWLVSGVAVNADPEMREMRSNDLLLEEIARRTGGRVLAGLDSPDTADLFSRSGLAITSSPLPVWDILIPILLGLVLWDVACRRIAWDWESTRKFAAAVAGKVRQFTLTREVQTEETLDALRRVRDEVAETKFKTAEPAAPPALPDRSAKFEASQAVEGDITQLVGGATTKPLPPPPKKIAPKGAMASEPGGHTSSLLEAKRRAQQKIREKERREQ